MSENRRVRSTARSISRSWFFRLFWWMLLLNAVLSVLVAGSFAYYHERADLGENWTIRLRRRIELADPGSGMDGNFFARLRGGQYIFCPDGGEAQSVPIAPFYDAARPFVLALLGFEAITLLNQLLTGRRQARRLLRPLDRMARLTREILENQQNFEHSPSDTGEKLHTLEDQINSISPTRPGEKLSTGDRDLSGLEEAINSLLQRTHEAYRQQTQFVSDASHELRTPIAVIQGYAAMLDRWGKSDEKILDESIQAIKSEGAYMKKLVDQLLFLARGDMGRARMELQEVSITELVKEVYEDSQLIDRAHDWRIETEENVTAWGDRDMLKQCVRILSDNAAKYTPEGGMIRLRARRGSNHEAQIEVQDSGIGIPRDDVRLVFDRFYRTDPARGRNSGGTGLGLAIAKWIAQSHDGHIEILSREGIGTRFTLCLRDDGVHMQPPQK